MNAYTLNNIIKEEINKVISENTIEEAKKLPNGFDELFKKYFSKLKKNHSNKKKYKNKKKFRKTVNGGKEYYDYDDYEKKNVKISLGDANSIRNSIDTEKTNIAAIARDFFPDHTDEGAQSQFRKIINGERPMTKKLAAKIEKYISQGKIAVK